MATWIENTNLGVYIADMGPYLGKDWPAQVPLLGPFPSDADEVDYFLFDPALADFTTWDYDDNVPYADSYAYDGGDGSYSDFGGRSEDMHLFVAWYPASGPPGVTPESLTPEAYSAIGELAPELTSGSWSSWVDSEPVLVADENFRQWWQESYAEGGVEEDPTTTYATAAGGATVSKGTGGVRFRKLFAEEVKNEDSVTQAGIWQQVYLFDFAAQAHNFPILPPEMSGLVEGTDYAKHDDYRYVQWEAPLATVQSGGHLTFAALSVYDSRTVHYPDTSDTDFYLLAVEDPPTNIWDDPADWYPLADGGAIASLSLHQEWTGVRPVDDGTLTETPGADFDADIDLSGLVVGTRLTLRAAPQASAPFPDWTPDPSPFDANYNDQGAGLVVDVWPQLLMLRPRFRYWIPGPTGRRQPLRQVSRPDPSRQYPRAAVDGSRQVGQIP